MSDYRLKTEEHMLLSMSKPAASPGDVETARRLIQSAPAVDFNWIINRAMENGMAPLLYWNMKEVQGVPEEFLQRLKKVYLYTAGRNLANEQEMLRVVRLLGSAGIEAMPLKGSIASRLFFGNHALYPATDLDLLVRPKDLKRAGKVLKDDGYLQNDAFAESDLLSSSYHLLYQKGKHHLELHWNLSKKYFSVPPEFWWEEAETVAYENVQLLQPSPERYLMYTIFRAFDHCFKPLKFLVLISAQIEMYRDRLDFGKLLSLSRRWRMERLTAFVLRLMHELLGTSVPGNAVHWPMAGYAFIRKKVMHGIFHGVGRLHLTMFIYTLLLDTPADFLRNAVRRTFPPMGEIRLRYGLPKQSGKAYAYYALNPFLILFGRKK
jgi:hypothetical protein